MVIIDLTPAIPIAVGSMGSQKMPKVSKGRRRYRSLRTSLKLHQSGIRQLEKTSIISFIYIFCLIQCVLTRAVKKRSTATRGCYRMTSESDD